MLRVLFVNRTSRLVLVGDFLLDLGVPIQFKISLNLSQDLPKVIFARPIVRVAFLGSLYI